MNSNLLISFSIGMIVLAATPGPGVFASMAKAMAEGFSASLYFIGGLVVGDMLFLLLAFLGLSVIANILGNLFILIRIIGGLYLIYLGIKIWKSVLVPLTAHLEPDGNRFRTWTGGFLVTLGNPKPILFYASVLPTIINMHEAKFLDIILMMAIIALVSFSVLGTYCYIASLSNKMAMNRRWHYMMNHVAGCVMVIVGVFVLMK